MFSLVYSNAQVNSQSVPGADRVFSFKKHNLTTQDILIGLLVINCGRYGNKALIQSYEN